MLPSQYQPTEIEHFIGPARQQARVLTALVASARPNRAPLKILASGPPGVGKTLLAQLFARLIGANQWTTTQFNGASIGIEEMEAMSEASHLREMWGDYRLFNWEEADRMSNAAQCAGLTMLDNLPAGNAVFATTNRPVKDFEPRFQRRFTVLEVPSPSADEIKDFLHRRFALPLAHATSIAQQAILGCGGVGQALQDADLALVSLQMAA